MPDGGSFQRAAERARVRVLLLLPSLQGGGAERVATHLLNRCDRSLLDMRLALLQRSGPYLSEVDAKRVDVSPLAERWLRFGGSNASFYRPERLLVGGMLAPANTAMMVRAFRPDVMMSGLRGMSVITYAARGLIGADRPRWIAREGNNTMAVIDDEVSFGPGRRLVKSVVRSCYHAADCVLANSQQMARGLRHSFGLEPSKLQVIHNPVDVPLVRALSEEAMPESPTRPFIVAAGRLEHQKGHDLLLKAFAASAACRELQLVIIGTGTLQAELMALASQLGIASRVRFLGFVENPWAYLSKARLFVLPSRWEGFPNIVCEALACGATTLVTDCDYGPGEIVAHGESGWVVPAGDAEALTRGMDRLLGDSDLCARLAAGARRRALQFDLQEMVRAYTELFMQQGLQRRAERGRIGGLQLAEL